MAWNILAMEQTVNWYSSVGMEWVPDSLRSKRLPLTYYTKIGARESMEATMKTQKNLWTKN